MNRESEKRILKLELEKRDKIRKASERKLEKYNRANQRVFNAISQEEIDEIKLEIETQILEIEILKTKIKDIGDE